MDTRKSYVVEKKASIIAEIVRYMAILGQALSYQIGQLKILELRKKSKPKSVKTSILKFSTKKYWSPEFCHLPFLKRK